MAISAEARQDLITLVVGMFDAAPSASILTQFVQDLNNGLTLTEMADNLTNTAEFQSEYKIWSTNEEFAAKFAVNLLDGHTSQTEIDFAADFVAGLLNNGASQGEAIVTAVQALEAVDNDDADFGDASAALENKVEVATYYAVEKLADADTLEALQAVVANVDETAGSVDDAKEVIDGGIVDGSIVTLTIGADGVVGTSANDLFRGEPTSNELGEEANVLSSGDFLDGGQGTDTLEVEIQTSYTVGGTAKAVKPNTDNIEVIKIEAIGEESGIGGESIDQNAEVRLNADDMNDITELWSNGSEASLRVENVKTSTNAPNTEDVTIVMKDTGNGGSETERDESDYEVYFHEQHLVAGQAAGQEALSFIMLDQTAYDNGEDPLTGFALDSLTVLLDGVEASMSFADPIADTPSTYQGLVDALNAQLAEIAPELVAEGLTFSVGGTFTDPDGRVGNEVRLSIPDEDESSTRLAFPNPDAPYTSVQFGSSPSNNIYRLADVVDPEAPTDLPVTATVILDEVGRGSDGGYLRVGSMSDDPTTAGSNISDAISTGIEDYKVTVDGSDTSSLSGLYTTNNTLKNIYITSAAGSTADLILGNDNTATVMGDTVTESGLTQINAGGFAGNLTLGTATNNIVDLQTLAASIDGNVTFYGEINTGGVYNYTTGGGADKLVIDLDGNAVDALGESFTLTTGSGDDTVNIDLQSGVSYNTMSQLDNLSVSTGAGADKVYIDDYGTFDVMTGSDSDFVEFDSVDSTDNSGEWTVGDNTGAQTFADRVLYQAKLTVSFAGFEETVTVATTSDNNFVANQVLLNTEIVRAISGNPELSALLKATLVDGNQQLKIESLIDGENSLSIALYQPRIFDTQAEVDGSAGSVLIGSSDVAALRQGLLATETVTNRSDDLESAAEIDTWAGTAGNNWFGSIDNTGDGDVTLYTDAEVEHDTAEVYDGSAHDDASDILDGAGQQYLSYSLGGSSNDTTGANFSTINVGSGSNDVIVLDSDVDSVQTIQITDSFGKISVVNFFDDSTDAVAADASEVGEHALDFTTYLNNQVDTSANLTGNTDSAVAQNVNVVVVDGAEGYTAQVHGATQANLIDANDIAVMRFNSDATDTFAGLSAEVLLAALNNTTTNDYGNINDGLLSATALANLVGTTQNHILMVENDLNEGEYKVFHLTSTVDSGSGAVTNGDFATATLLGTMDFGASINVHAVGNTTFDAALAAAKTAAQAQVDSINAAATAKENADLVASAASTLSSTDGDESQGIQDTFSLTNNSTQLATSATKDGASVFVEAGVALTYAATAHNNTAVSIQLQDSTATLAGTLANFDGDRVTVIAETDADADIAISAATANASYDLSNVTSEGTTTVTIADVTGATTLNVVGNVVVTNAGHNVNVADVTGDVTISATDDAVTLATDDSKNGTVTVSSNANTLTITGDSAVTVTNADNNAAEVAASAATGAITVTAGANGDVIVTGAAADTITGGAGQDTITGGAAADSITITDTADAQDTVILNSLATTDTIVGFDAGNAGTDDILHIDFSELEGAGDLINLDDAVSWTDNTDTPVLGAITGATDLATVTAETNILVANLAANIADTDALETALEAGGDLALTANNAIALGDTFLAAYDDGANTYIAKVVVGGDGAADDGTFATGELTATNIAQLSGVTDVTTLNAANFDFIA